MDLLEISKSNTKKKIPLYIKVLSLFSVVRGYNISLIVIAQYLAAVFIFAPEKSLMNILMIQNFCKKVYLQKLNLKSNLMTLP